MLSPLDRFDRLIVESEARIDEQRKLIEVFEEQGMNTVESKKRLRDFEDSLEAYRQARATVLQVQKLADEDGRSGL